MRNLNRTALLLWLCCVQPQVIAEVYKWTDADGRVHFGDRPPHGKAATVQLPAAATDTPAATPEQRLEQQRRLLRAYDEERRLKRDARAQAQRDAEDRQRRCAQARDDLHNREFAGGLYRLGPDGQREFLNDAERESAVAEARAAVEQWCGKQ